MSSPGGSTVLLPEFLVRYRLIRRRASIKIR